MRRGSKLSCLTMLARPIFAILALVPVPAALSQTPASPATDAKPLQFEVASVRPVVAAQGTTGAGVVTIAPDRVSYEGITLKSLLMRAYDLEPFQISGPAWMDSERYDLIATIPEGVPKEEVPVMLQHLLTERFRMTLHFETKDSPGYILGIGKGGPKLVPAKNQKPVSSADPDASRYPRSISFTMGGSSPVVKVNRATMQAFAGFLSQTLRRPVIDSTKLPGEFDIVLPVSMSEIQSPGAQEVAGAGGPPVESDSSMSLFTAIHDLGLTLSSVRVPLKCIAVDKAEKIPVEN